MNDLQIFNNDEFGQIRTVEIDGKPYFGATDVARALGYSNPHDAISRHCKGVVKHEGVSKTVNQYEKETIQTDNINFIPEGDVYRLIIRSKLPSAEKFESWVFDEVLPTIRKTGGYQMPQTYAEALRALADKAEEAERLKHENNVLITQNAELQPKASYFDVVLHGKDLLKISVIAKDYGWSAQRLNNFLAEQKIQYKSGDIWLLYQKYAEKGYTSTQTFPCKSKSGEIHNRVHTYWTQNGRLFIYEKMKEAGVLPIMERE
jgi:prophage antirepressor-like protein